MNNSPSILIQALDKTIIAEIAPLLADLYESVVLHLTGEGIELAESPNEAPISLTVGDETPDRLRSVQVVWSAVPGLGAAGVVPVQIRVVADTEALDRYPLLATLWGQAMDMKRENEPN